MQPLVHERISEPTKKSGDLHYFEFIDGLRCIAVLFVLFFHAKIGAFSGGFIGVDIFFVISGFLMTRILASREPSFSNFVIFLTARFRRIFPAYILMLPIVTGIAILILFPDDLLKLAPGLIAAVFFVSNFVFRDQANYFDKDLFWNPILHTWSLAVEGQFYLLFPLVLMAARRYAVSPWLLSGFIGAVSFGWSICGAYGWYASATAAFFLLPARLWEFLIGTIAALAPAKLERRKGLAEVLCVAGLAILFWCAFFYDIKTIFPGPGAVLPCLGTALVIYCSSVQTIVARLLSLPPLRLIGQASYSIYLWHWPLVVFYKYRFVANDDDLGAGATAMIILAAILFGIASWKFVELPFRKNRTRVPPGAESGGSRSAGIAAGAAAIPVLASLLILAMHGLPARFSKDIVAISAARKDTGSFRECARDGNPCRLGSDGEKPSFFLWGDSHAAALAVGIDEQARNLGKAGFLVAAHGCAPLFNVEGTWAPARDVCRATQARIPQLLAEMKPDLVILHGIWESYGGPAFEAAIDRTFRYLHEHKLNVLVLGDTPGARTNVPFALARHEAFGLQTKMTFSLDVYLASSQNIGDLLRHYSEKYGFQYIDLGQSMCRTGTCLVAADGKPLYFDSHHLSAFGARYVVRENGAWLDNQ